MDEDSEAKLILLRLSFRPFTTDAVAEDADSKEEALGRMGNDSAT